MLIATIAFTAMAWTVPVVSFFILLDTLQHSS